MISFSVLAVLALMTRWPVPRWGIVLILAIYGGMTEIIQRFTCLTRTPRWTDWFQDLIGIAVGNGVLLGRRDVGRQVHRGEAKSGASAAGVVR